MFIVYLQISLIFQIFFFFYFKFLFILVRLLAFASLQGPSQHAGGAFYS